VPQTAEPSRSEQPWGVTDASIGDLLAQRARADGNFTYCRAGDRTVSVRDLDLLSNRIANGLSAAGVRSRDRVAVMLANSIEHIALFFALAKLGACQVPINIHLRGSGLDYILRASESRCAIVEGNLAGHVAPAISAAGIDLVFWRGPSDGLAGADFGSLLAHAEATAPAVCVKPDDLVYISFTSGTTGMPKGVMMTDRMLRVAAWAASRLGDLREGDVFHMWEPFYHIGGCEVLLLAVQHRVTIALVPKFSVSRFWEEVRACGATHIHFLGGVLALLLKETPSPRDRDHRVRIAWGGGCPEPVWRAFQDRFGIAIRECYGMTECASFATQNMNGKIGSVGKPLPYFEVQVVDDNGNALGPNQRGEIRIRERVPGILTKGYWRNPEATAALFEGGFLRTGDLGLYDADGDFVYLGRKKDSLRRRGENIAAFEVERILNEHPDIEESAIVGVPNDLSDEDIKAIVRLTPGRMLAPIDLIKWCEGRMAYFQIPRYIQIVEDMPRTPSQRIRKELLSRGTGDCWDLESSGYIVKR
jgi:crotonobetaine/carnitine-CoA ligase